MDYPLWLIPILPLIGFVLNGAVALATGSAKARKASAEWNGLHGHGHGHDTSAPEEETRPGEHTGGHGGHDPHDDHAEHPLPYWQRLFHGIVGVGSVGLAAVLSFGVLVPYIADVLSSGEGIR